jgi:hypothetical protein
MTVTTTVAEIVEASGRVATQVTVCVVIVPVLVY